MFHMMLQTQQPCRLFNIPDGDYTKENPTGLKPTTTTAAASASGDASTTTAAVSSHEV